MSFPQLSWLQLSYWPSSLSYSAWLHTSSGTPVFFTSSILKMLLSTDYSSIQTRPVPLRCCSRFNFIQTACCRSPECSVNNVSTVLLLLMVRLHNNVTQICYLTGQIQSVTNQLKCLFDWESS